MTETHTCGLCEARTCTDDAGCGDNETCVDGKCTCPNGFWINNCQCVACLEGSTPRLENDAVDCICPELYVWKNGECVPCVEDLRNMKSSSTYDPEYELNQCSNSCPEGYYATYANTHGTANLTASCKQLKDFSIDSMTDQQLLDKYNMLLTYSGYSGSLGTEEKKLFGDDPTADDIRTKLHELLDDYYLPGTYETWWGAQSWCLARGGRLITREKYYENNAQLRFATSFIASWNYLRYWADGIQFGSGWSNGRSTTWQSGGWDSTPNTTWFICEK